MLQPFRFRRYYAKEMARSQQNPGQLKKNSLIPQKGGCLQNEKKFFCYNSFMMEHNYFFFCLLRI